MSVQFYLLCILERAKTVFAFLPITFKSLIWKNRSSVQIKRTGKLCVFTILKILQ